MNNINKYLNSNSDIEIIMYNGLNNDNIDENFVSSIDDIINKFDRLYEFGLTMSGFQFVGLTLEQNSLGSSSDLYKASYFLLALCFLFSLFGSTIAYIISKFLTSIKYENKEFVLAGIRNYKSLFTFTEFVPYLNSGLFLITMNILIHTELEVYFGIIFNCASFLLFLSGLILVYRVNFRKQRFFNLDKSDKIDRIKVLEETNTIN